jgi:ADP-ribose pyrophosphatase YjhB (NUDIX family)
VADRPRGGRNPLRLRSLPRLLIVGLHEAAALLAGRYARSEGAHAVVRDESGELLVVLPIFPPRRWGIPGGKVGQRETPHAAVVREVREETGLEVVVERCLLVDGHRWRSTDFIFACRSIGGRLRPQPEEIAEVRWMADAEIARTSPKLARLLSLLPTGAEGTRYRSER